MIEVDVRWTFVSKGILLWMHACMSWNGTSPNLCLFVTRLSFPPFVCIDPRGALPRTLLSINLYTSMVTSVWNFGQVVFSCGNKTKSAIAMVSQVPGRIFSHTFLVNLIFVKRKERKVEA